MKQLLRRTGHVLYGLGFTAAFAGVALCMLLVLCVIPDVRTRRRIVHRAAVTLFRIVRTPLAIAGLEHIPEESCIVVANHASYLDGIILKAALPPRFAFVIKREMTRVPFAHFLLRRIGSEFVERFDAHRGAMDTRRILQRAGNRQSLAFFPEGTFGPEPGLRRFQLGAFVIATRNHLPVVPIVIRGSRQMMPAGRVLPRPGRIEVDIRPSPDSDAHGSARALLETTRRMILERLPEPDLGDPPAA